MAPLAARDIRGPGATFTCYYAAPKRQWQRDCKIVGSVADGSALLEARNDSSLT
jgi:hypothetical protein